MCVCVYVCVCVFVCVCVRERESERQCDRESERDVGFLREIKKTERWKQRSDGGREEERRGVTHLADRLGDIEFLGDGDGAVEREREYLVLHQVAHLRRYL